MRCLGGSSLELYFSEPCHNPSEMQASRQCFSPAWHSERPVESRSFGRECKSEIVLVLKQTGNSSRNGLPSLQHYICSTALGNGPNRFSADSTVEGTALLDVVQLGNNAQTATDVCDCRAIGEQFRGFKLKIFELSKLLAFNEKTRNLREL